MPGIVRVCLGRKLPRDGEVREMHAGGRQFCVARVDGDIAVLDNVCPHKDAPLSEGYVEKGRVVCPWHEWAFDLTTGKQHKGETHVRVYEATLEEGELFVTLS